MCVGRGKGAGGWPQAHRNQVIIKWRGKPVFIRHRTDDEIKDADDTAWEALRDPQPDSDRVKKPEWLVMLGMCMSFLRALSMAPYSFLSACAPAVWLRGRIRCSVNKC